MRKRIEKITAWQKEGRKIALATVIKVYGSAPQPLGAVMAINDALEFDGSVSGGCVEGDVIRQASAVIETDQARLVEYGISNDTAWEVGLACGGTIEVFIEPLNMLHRRVMALLEEKCFFATVAILDTEHAGRSWIAFPNGELESTEKLPALEEEIRPIVTRALENKKSMKAQASVAGETASVFCTVYPPPARLLIIGAVHIAMPLVSLAEQFEFETIVIDARSAFTTSERFPHASHLITDWPADALQKLGIDENTFIAFLSHDEKIDNPALLIALESKARYIGALGSRKTHAKRVKALIETGADEKQIQRIHAPIGIDIGAVGAEQIALSIMSEIIAVCNAKTSIATGSDGITYVND